MGTSTASRHFQVGGFGRGLTSGSEAGLVGKAPTGYEYLEVGTLITGRQARPLSLSPSSPPPVSEQ